MSGNFRLFLSTIVHIDDLKVTYQCRVSPGNYIIIPSTYDVDKEVKFLLRVYTESRIDTIPMNIDKPDVNPNELDFRDGKGPDQQFDIKHWWDSLPPEERDRLKKLAGAAAVGTVALCCCFQLV